MSEFVNDIIRFLEEPRPNALKKIEKEITELSRVDLPKELLRLSKVENSLKIFTSIMPTIAKLIMENKISFKVMCNMFKEFSHQMPQDISRLVFEYLRKLKNDPKYNQDIKKNYLDAILSVIRNPVVPVPLICDLIRAMEEDACIDEHACIDALVKTSLLSPDNVDDLWSLMEEVGHVVYSWKKYDMFSDKRLKDYSKNKVLKIKKAHKDLIEKLLNFASRNASHVLELPGIQSFLSNCDHPDTVTVTNGLIVKANKPHHFASLLSTLHKCIDDDQITLLISKHMNANHHSADIIGSIVEENPKILDILFKKKRYIEYLFAYSKIFPKENTKENKEIVKHLEQINKTSSSMIKSKLRNVTRLLPHNVRMELFSKKIISNQPRVDSDSQLDRNADDIYKSITPMHYHDKITSLTPTKGFEKIPNFKEDSSAYSWSAGYVENGTEPFCYPADAIYSEGQTPHWHAGLYYGISVINNEIIMKGLHMTGKWYSVFIGLGSGIEYLISTKTSRNPIDNLKYLINNLQAEFQIIFTDSKVFHGRASRDDLSDIDRKAIINIAERFPYKGIRWNFSDMIIQRPGQIFRWDGTVSDILYTRCDGVVEYCYEKYGKKVCEGQEVYHKRRWVKKWNISSPGREHLIAHANFHEDDHKHNDIKEGELCPRIQSSAKGNDSTFNRNPVKIPEVLSLRFLHNLENAHPIIDFHVKADESDTIFVRVLVKKEGNGNFEFLVADNVIMDNEKLLHDTLPCQPVGLAECNKLDSICWLGKTVTEIPSFGDWKVNQKDYWGQNGQYTFHIIFLDKGGNLSSKIWYKLDINWPAEKPTCESD